MSDSIPAGPLVAMADDDAAQSELVETWLRMLGYDVVAFPDGDSLFNWASASSRGRPAAVLLDVEMPGSSGFETCRSLRTLPGYDRVPVACVSSLDPQALDRGARAAGADASLHKDAQLLPRLAEWLTAA